MSATFRDLIAWQKGMDLVEVIYHLTKLLPAEERFGLCDQMRRSAVSIPSNIAEGQSRGTTKDFRHFLTIAFASRAEVQTQLLICERIGYLTREQTKEALLLTERLGALLTALTNSLQ